MGYTSLINSGVNTAFKAVADLARTATLHKVVQGSFNFGSGSFSPTESSITIKVVDIGAPTKSSTDANVLKKKIMFNLASIGDITVYDYVVDTDGTWKLGPIIKDTGFVIVLEVYRSI